MLGHRVNLSKLKNVEITNATTLDEDMAGSILNSFITIIIEVFNLFKASMLVSGYKDTHRGIIEPRDHRIRIIMTFNDNVKKEYDFS
jgi:hypothetical protein